MLRLLRVGSGRPLRVGRWAGVEVQADASWPVVALALTGTVWADAAAGGGRPVGVGFGVAAVVTAGFFVSVLVHELAHALEARHRGATVRGVILLPFGGITDLAPGRRRARDELAASAVGVFTSAVLGAGLGIAATVARVAGTPDAALAAGMLAWLNIGLAVVNLLPGLPFDGGRLLGTFLARVTRNEGRSVAVAAGAGVVLAGLVLAAGVVQVVRGDNTVAGFWLIGLGWVLLRSARRARPMVGPDVPAPDAVVRAEPERRR